MDSVRSNNPAKEKPFRGTVGKMYRTWEDTKRRTEEYHLNEKPLSSR